MRTRAIPVFGVLLILSACASDDNKSQPICPQVAIVRELQDARDYGDETPGPGQLVAEARMQKITGDCEYQDDGVDVSFDLQMIAARGPRLGGDRIDVPFFAAVLDPQQTILKKNMLTASFEFSDEAKPAEDTESLHVFVPLAKDKQAAGPNYQVLLGFQLTPEQLEAVREQKEKTP